MNRYYTTAIFFVLLLAASFFAIWSSQTEAATCADYYDATKTPPAGFGVPYNLFSFFHELLLKTISCDQNAAQVSIGNGLTSTLVYKTAFQWSSSGWKAVPLTSSNTLIANAWYVGRANGTVTYQSGSTQNYYVGYVCQVVDGRWKCGCRDTACYTPMWQAQRIDVAGTTAVSSGGGSSSRGSSGGGGGGRGSGGSSSGGGGSSTPAPTTAIEVSPPSILDGNTATLTWSSSNATACQGTGFSTGDQTAGSISVTPLSDTTYAISCTGAGGTASAQTTITVTSSTTVTATLAASSTSLTEGQSTTLSWSSNNTTSCTGTNFSTGSATAGSVTISPTTTTAFSISCTGAGGSATATTTVDVTLVPAITASCAANPTAITTGGNTNWTATVSGGTGSYTYSWSGTDSITGTTNPLTTTYSASGTKTAQVTITSGPRTSTVSCTNTVTVTDADTIAPIVSITSPTNGTSTSRTISLIATASDAVGVAGIQFTVDGVNLGSEGTSSPYSIFWNTLTATDGAHTLAAVARDAAGNRATSTITVTIDNTAPIISAVASSTAVATATVTWTTNESSNARVVYGLTTSYGLATSSASLLTSHTLILTNLASSTLYHYAVVSTDALGNTSTSSDYTFLTATAPDVTAPSVSLTAPTNGATVSGTVVLAATASDNVAVAGVTFKVNGVMVGAEDTISPYTLSWDSTATSSGSKTIVAVARDTSGNYATSSAIVVTVDNTAPIISSVASTTGTATATVTWTTDESSNSKVVYGLSTSYGSASTSATLLTSHTVVLSGLASSTTYHYAVVSTDAQGNTATSSDYTFTTSAPPDTTVPTVSITAPTNGATVTGTTTLSATASDNVGIVGVEFFLDGTTLLQDEKILPYSFGWNTRLYTDGSHTIAAVARDAAGNRATSTITITIQNVTATLAASSTSLTEGQSTTLSWSSNNTTSCTGTNFSTGSATAGSVTISPTATTTYNISCTGAGGSATATTTVNVTLVPAIVASCSASPTLAATSTTVTWTATVSGGTGSYTYSWSGTDSITGTVNPLMVNYTTSGTKTAQVNIISGPRSSNVSCSNSVLVDTTTPSGIANLAATPVSSSQVNLTWNASVDAESGVPSYQIWRCATANCTPSSAGAQVGTATTNAYSDMSLFASTTYRYQVRAVNGVGVFSTFNAIPKPATTSAAELSIDYSTAGSPGPFNRIAAGYLHGLNTSLGSGPLISPTSLWSSLAPKFLRTSPSKVLTHYAEDKRLRGGTTSVMMIATLAGDWGYPSASGTPPWITASNATSSYTNPDYTDWLNYVVTKVNAIKAIVPQAQRMYDFWNEPNGSDFWGDYDVRESAANTNYSHFKELYRLTYQLLKVGLPGFNGGVALDPDVPFTAPGTSNGLNNLNETFTRNFMKYAKDNNVVPDYWNWHFGDPQTLTIFNRNMQYAADIGASRDAMVLEYLRSADGRRPGRAIYELAMLESATATSGKKVLGATRARWTGITTEAGDSLFASGGTWKKTGIWYMYANYAKMTGNEATFVNGSTPALGAVASIDATTKKAWALLGNNSYDQAYNPDDTVVIATSSIRLGGIQSGDGSGYVTVTVSKIPYNNFSEVNDIDIAKIIDSVQYPVVNNAISISLPWGLAIDGYFVEITNVSPQ